MGASQGLGDALALALARRGAARKIALIAKARIPIVKFEEAASGFLFDISFDVANGPAAAEWMREQMAALPPLRPLSLVLKAFLQQRCARARLRSFARRSVRAHLARGAQGVE